MIRVEWKPQDLWIGAYWKATATRFDLWVCLLPCVPIHLAIERRAKETEP